MKALPILAFGVSAITASLIQRGNADPPPSPTTAVTPPSLHGDDCRGGEEDGVTVRIEPDEILSTGRGGQRIALGVHVHHHFDAAASVIGAVEVIDDRGQRIGKHRELGLRSVAAQAPTSYQIETPDQLADGYYRVQVSVLARPGNAATRDADDFSTHQLYFHATGGSVTPITSDEWLTRSQAGLVFTSR